VISSDDLHWMQTALTQAKQCLRKPPLPTDVPVGAVCVLDNKAIGFGHNMRELRSDPAAHAEVLALQQAARYLNSWHLENVTLYVTLEPCFMCAGAIWQSRISRLVFGAWDSKAGACGSIYDIPRDPRLNHQMQVRGGVMEEECKIMLQDFFKTKRL
jgi:tRNA(adenine34) deaminase